MGPERSLSDVLHIAIQQETEAHALYTRAERLALHPEAQQMLHDLAEQETGHRLRLEALLRDSRLVQNLQARTRRTEDLQITDHLVEVPLSPDASLQEILIVAGKREKGSHDLYAALGRVAEEDKTRALFAFLAAEELSHKRRVEEMYEQLVLQDN